LFSKSGQGSILILELVKTSDQLRVVALVETENLDIVTGAQTDL